MRYLITGVGGQLGYDVKKELQRREMNDIYAPTSSEMDITNEKQTKEIITKYNPDVIFHCAAWTNVDGAEDEYKDKCYDINANGTKYIAEAAKDINAKVIYISTDYVFDGNKEKLYEVTDTPNPQNVYGMTKYIGEQAVISNLNKYFVTRISWVFGENAKKNFIKTMLNLAENHNELNVVSDQIGSPTYTADLSKLLVDMSQTDKYGIYHATNEGYVSWADFARCIFETSCDNVIVHDILSENYPQKAYRPKNSCLSKTSLDQAGFDRLPNYEDAVKRYVKKMKSME